MTEVLYFGSFNPVHFGHVAIVEYVAAMNEVDAVTIVPSPPQSVQGPVHSG